MTDPGAIAEERARDARASARFGAAIAVASVISVQSGAALATELFKEIGTGGAVFLRALVAGVALVLIGWRSLGAVRERRIGDTILFGLVVAGVTFCFYGAIDRLPLGVAVTIQFSGPLAVAVVGARRKSDLLWVAMAAAGILLLTGGPAGADLDPVGFAFAFAAAAFWAAYIVLSARVGANHPGVSGAAVSAMVTALVLAPLGIAEGGAALLDPSVIAIGIVVGLLSSAVPFALEMEALRRIPKATFGVLMSLEPAAAAAIGFIALSQVLSGVQVLAVALVVCASAGALRSAQAGVPLDP